MCNDRVVLFFLSARLPLPGLTLTLPRRGLGRPAGALRHFLGIFYFFLANTPKTCQKTSEKAGNWVYFDYFLEIHPHFLCFCGHISLKRSIYTQNNPEEISSGLQ